MRTGWLAALVGLLACGGPAAERPPLALRSVDGNPAEVPLGRIDGLAEIDGALVVFGARGATTLRGGAVSASDTSVRSFRPGSAAVVPAADGNGRWVVAIAADGRPLRLAALATLEEIGPRFGVASAIGVGAAGARDVALALPDGVAVADGAHVKRYPGRFTAVAGGGGRLVLAAQNRVEIWDLARGTSSAYGVTGVSWVGLTASGMAVVASPASLWVEGRDGALMRRLGTSGIHGIAVAGERVWVAAGTELVVVEGGHAWQTRGASLGRDARLAPAADGGVWVATDGKLRRYAVGGGDDWGATVGPIFTRVCSRCHLPGGSADVDLSTASAWKEHRDAIRRRVVDKGDMPPPGTALPAADRQAIARWLSDPNGFR